MCGGSPLRGIVHKRAVWGENDSEYTARFAPCGYGGRGVSILHILTVNVCMCECEQACICAFLECVQVRVCEATWFTCIGRLYEQVIWVIIITVLSMINKVYV